MRRALGLEKPAASAGLQLMVQQTDSLLAASGNFVLELGNVPHEQIGRIGG